MRPDGGGYRRDHLRALAQRVEVDQKELRIMGSKSVLLRTLVAAESAKTAGFSVPSSVPKWRTRHDSNVWPLPSEGNAEQKRAPVRSRFYSWRKIEEAKRGGADFLLKLLKSLALPRGIEPLFQP